MFSAGEVIFYPMHGIGTVRAATAEGYEIYLEEEDVNIKISQTGAAARGLRYPLGKEEFFRQLEAAREEKYAVGTSWRERRRETAENLKSGEVRQVARVLLYLEEKAEEKPLSATEIRMRHIARQIIQSEIRFILDIDEKKAKELLANFMNY